MLFLNECIPHKAGTDLHQHWKAWHRFIIKLGDVLFWKTRDVPRGITFFWFLLLKSRQNVLWQRLSILERKKFVSVHQWKFYNLVTVYAWDFISLWAIEQGSFLPLSLLKTYSIHLLLDDAQTQHERSVSMRCYIGTFSLSSLHEISLADLLFQNFSAIILVT